jgi:hypothetical protein
MTYLATDSGIYVLEYANDRWYLVRHSLENRYITSITDTEGILFAGTKAGIAVSLDLGCSWEERNTGLVHPHIRSLRADRNSQIFAGTEPAAIFRSKNLGQTWKRDIEVEMMRDQFGWSLPYSDNAGCIRDFCLDGRRMYAAVEQGGILFKTKPDERWYLVDGSTGYKEIKENGVHADVHSIYVSPESEKIIYACTGGGLYRSVDSGKIWNRLYECYCRAAWIDPINPQHIIFGPAESVDENGRIEESHNLAQWTILDKNFDILWPNTMVEKFVGIESQLWALLSDGRVFQASLDNWIWQPIFENISAIRDIHLI